jgi:hypothetical protein
MIPPTDVNVVNEEEDDENQVFPQQCRKSQKSTGCLLLN